MGTPDPFLHMTPMKGPFIIHLNPHLCSPTSMEGLIISIESPHLFLSVQHDRYTIFSFPYLQHTDVSYCSIKKKKKRIAI